MNSAAAAAATKSFSAEATSVVVHRDQRADILVAVEAFVERAQVMLDEHTARMFPSLESDVLSVEPGRRYAKIVRTCRSGAGRSVYCFVDMSNGDILKAESWSKPAKHARGNVVHGDSLAAVTPYGARYIR